MSISPLPVPVEAIPEPVVSDDKKGNPFEIRLEISPIFPRSNKFSGRLKIENRSGRSVKVALRPIREPEGVTLLGDDILSKLRTSQVAKFRACQEALTRYFRLQNACNLAQANGGASGWWYRAQTRVFYRISRSYHRVGRIYTLGQLESSVPEEPLYPEQTVLLKLIHQERAEARQLEHLISACDTISIPAGEPYERIFVMECARDTWNTQIHDIVAEVEFQPLEDQVIQRTDIKKIDVAPNSVLLGFVAAFWSLVGIGFSFWSVHRLPGLSDEEMKDTDLFQIFLLLDLTLIPAFSFAVFNIIEYLKISDTISSIKLSWRSAMIIGIVCGALFVRIAASVTGLFGR